MSNIFSNLGNFVKIANSIKNPKEAISISLNMLGKKNPQLAGMLQMAINSGKDPKEYIKEGARNGQFNIKQLNELKNAYAMASKMGLTKKIPEDIWKDAENALNTGTVGSNTQMSGF